MTRFLGGSRPPTHKSGKKSVQEAILRSPAKLHLAMRTPTAQTTLSCLTPTSFPASLILLAESST